jgi:hypothetical protein
MIIFFLLPSWSRIPSLAIIKHSLFLHNKCFFRDPTIVGNRLVMPQRWWHNRKLFVNTVRWKPKKPNHVCENRDWRSWNDGMNKQHDLEAKAWLWSGVVPRRRVSILGMRREFVEWLCTTTCFCWRRADSFSLTFFNLQTSRRSSQAFYTLWYNYWRRTTRTPYVRELHMYSIRSVLLLAEVGHYYSVTSIHSLVAGTLSYSLLS